MESADNGIVISDDPEKVRSQLSKLSREQRYELVQEAKATLAREDFVYYCEYVHKWKLTPHQKEWANILQTERKACIVAPVESSKSRIVRSWLEWEIGHNVNSATLLIQATSGQSSNQLQAMAAAFVSYEYKRVFPHVQPTDRWSGEKMFLKRETFRPEATVAGFGITGSYQGLHVDKLIIDDPTNPEDVHSPSQMQKQRDAIRGVLLDRLKMDGHLFVILTRWADDDLVPTIEEIGVPIYVYPAWREEPYAWGSQFLDETSNMYGNQAMLDALLAKKGPDLFKLTFLCESAGAVRGTRIFGDQLRKEKHFKKDSKVAPWVFVKHALGIDFGTTQQHKSAMVAASRTDRGVVVVRAAWESAKGSSEEIAAKARIWKGDYDTRYAWVDRSQQSLMDMLKLYAGVQCFKANNKVDWRIGALLTLLDANKFVIDADAPGAQKLWDALMSYARDETGHVIEKADDLIDALLYAVCALEERKTVGIGPDVEIVDAEDDIPMADAYHDSFDPKKHSTAGVKERSPYKTMKDFGALV